MPAAGGLRLTPKLQHDSASGALQVKSRCSTGTSKFHQTLETQHCKEPTVNEICSLLSEHSIINILSVLSKSRGFAIATWA